MFEMITPEMITIAIASLAALTFLMVLITIASLSRVKKRLLLIAGKSLELEEKQEALRQTSLRMVSDDTAGLAEAADKITSIERRLDAFDNIIAESQNQLTGHASKLNEHDTLLGQAGQMMGKNAIGFTQAMQRIHTLEEKLQDLEAFQSTFEQTRNRILDALGARQPEMPPQDTLTAERKALKEEVPIPSEEELPDTEDFHKPRIRPNP